MPLQKGKSKAAFSHNVSTEMHAGKPQNQALAIAYSEKRHSHSLGDTPGVKPHEGDTRAFPKLESDPRITEREHDPLNMMDGRTGLEYKVEHYDGTNVRVWKTETTGIPTFALGVPAEHGGLEPQRISSKKRV
jgi:hypothetical protein